MPEARVLSAIRFFGARGRTRLSHLRAGRLAANRVPISQVKIAHLSSVEEVLRSDDPDVVRSLDNVQARLVAGARFGDDDTLRNQVFCDFGDHEVLPRALANLQRSDAWGSSSAWSRASSDCAGRSVGGLP